MSADRAEFTIADSCNSVKYEIDSSFDVKSPLLSFVKEEAVLGHGNDDSIQSFHIDDNINNSTDKKPLNGLDLDTENNNNEVKTEEDYGFNNLGTLINAFNEEPEEVDDHKIFESEGTVLRREYSSTQNASNKFRLEVEYEDKIIKIEKEILENDLLLESEIVIEKNGIHRMLNEDRFNVINDSKLADSPKSDFNEVVHSSDKADQNNGKSIKRSYTCDLCHHSFNRKNVLIYHMKNHYSKNFLTNNFSKIVLPKSIKYKLLKMTHTKKKTFECLVCRKQFSDQSNCNRHIKMHFHTIDNHFECHICMKTFNREANLRVHYRIHTGENPYKCDICQLTFYRNDLMQSHRKIHGKKYSVLNCDKCQKTFNSNSSLKRHKKIHKKEKPYSCDNCQEFFSRKDSLIVHMRSKHTGERPYKCRTCNKSYFENSVLLRHKNSAHKKGRNT